MLKHKLSKQLLIPSVQTELLWWNDAVWIEILAWLDGLTNEQNIRTHTHTHWHTYVYVYLWYLISFVSCVVFDSHPHIYKTTYTYMYIQSSEVSRYLRSVGFAQSNDTHEIDIFFSQCLSVKVDKQTGKMFLYNVSPISQGSVGSTINIAQRYNTLPTTVKIWTG